MSIPPGWYADPRLVDQRRYWDGDRWAPAPNVLPWERYDPDDESAVDGQQARLSGRARVRLVLVGLAGLGVCAVVAVVGSVLRSPHIVAAGIPLGAIGLVALWTAAFGRARSRSRLTRSRTTDAVTIHPSLRIHRVLLVVSFSALLVLAATCAAVLAAGEVDGGMVALGVCVVVFAGIGWYAAWGLLGRNRLTVDAWGVRFGTPRGVRALRWDEIEGFRTAQVGAAVRPGYLLLRRRSPVWRALRAMGGGVDATLPLGYQPEDVATIATVAASRPRSPAVPAPPNAW